jgi:CRISPR/Cas system endoribonuclease Cas6 (RAMP superfamily)
VFQGNINGAISFKQNKAIYKPTASLVIDHLNINKTDLGDLKFDIEGTKIWRNSHKIRSWKMKTLSPLMLLVISKLSIKRRFLT